MELACKLVVNASRNGAGMRWSHEGADAMGHLQALYPSERPLWSEFGANRRKAA